MIQSFVLGYDLYITMLSFIKNRHWYVSKSCFRNLGFLQSICTRKSAVIVYSKTWIKLGFFNDQSSVYDHQSASKTSSSWGSSLSLSNLLPQAFNNFNKHFFYNFCITSNYDIKDRQRYKNDGLLWVQTFKEKPHTLFRNISG